MIYSDHPQGVKMFMLYCKYMQKTKNRSKTMLSILSNPRYRGKHVIIIEGKVHTAQTGKQANQLLDRLEKKYPHATPAITYIPKTDTLILWV